MNDEARDVRSPIGTAGTLGVDALHFEPHLPRWVAIWPVVLALIYLVVQYRVGRRFGARGLLVGWLLGTTALITAMIAMRMLANIQVLGHVAVPDAAGLIGIGAMVGLPAFGLSARSVVKRQPRLAGRAPRWTDLLAGVGAWFAGALVGLIPALVRDIVAVGAGR